MLEAITFGVVITCDDAIIMYNYRSRCNYTRAELPRKRYTLDSTVKRSMRARRLNATQRLGVESPEAKRSPKSRYSTSTTRVHIST